MDLEGFWATFLQLIPLGKVAIGFNHGYAVAAMIFELVNERSDEIAP